VLRVGRDCVVDISAGDLLRDSFGVQRFGAAPTGTVDSKITIAIAGRTSMLRECRASGDDTHRNSVSERGANQTGEIHGPRSASAVAIVMYMFASTIRRAAEIVSM
jgi:hypothetical protein